MFLARFTLDESEIEALTSRDIPIGQQFFDAMDETKRIREDWHYRVTLTDTPTNANDIQISLDMVQCGLITFVAVDSICINLVRRAPINRSFKINQQQTK